MDLKDWVGVSDQINQIAGVREASERTKVYGAAQALDEKRVDRDIRNDDEAREISRQTSEIYNSMRAADQQAAPSAAPPVSVPSLSAVVGAGGNSSAPTAAPGSLAEAVQLPPAPTTQAAPAAVDFGKYHPKALSDATVLYEADKSREWLRDERNQKLIKEKAERAAEGYGQSLAKAEQLIASGRSDMAADLYASAYNAFFDDGYSAAVDPESGDIVLTSPTGKQSRRRASDLPQMVQGDREVLHSKKFADAYVGSRLAAIGFNRDALMAPSPVVDRDGKTVAYRVRSVDWRGKSYVPQDVFYDSPYPATAQVLTLDQVKSMGGMEMDESDRLRDSEANKQNRERLQVGGLTDQERKLADKAADDAVDVVKDMVGKQYGQADPMGKISPLYDAMMESAITLNSTTARASRGQMNGHEVAGQTYSYLNRVAAQGKAEFDKAVKAGGSTGTPEAEAEFVARYVRQEAQAEAVALEKKYGIGPKTAAGQDDGGRFSDEFAYMNTLRGSKDGTVFQVDDAKTGMSKRVTVKGGKFFDDSGKEVFFGGQAAPAPSPAVPPPNPPVQAPQASTAAPAADPSGAPGSRVVQYPGPVRPMSAQERDAFAARQAASKLMNWGGLAEYMKKNRGR